MGFILVNITDATILFTSCDTLQSRGHEPVLGVPRVPGRAGPYRGRAVRPLCRE